MTATGAASVAGSAFFRPGRGPDCGEDLLRFRFAQKDHELDVACLWLRGCSGSPAAGPMAGQSHEWNEPWGATVLKGHGFSRAGEWSKMVPALEHFRNTYRLFDSRRRRLFLEKKAT
jgi:hypothetical protein